MTKIRKTVALLLCLCMLWGTAAMAEDAAATTDTAATAVTELNDTDVLATIDGEDVTWSDIKSVYANLVSQYGSYYDLTQQANVDLFRAVALENCLTEELMMQKAKEFGVDQLTQEEIDAAVAQADSDWDAAIDNYISYFYSDLTEESSEEEKAAAEQEAVSYYNDAGYTPESLREDYQRYSVLGKVEDMMTQDATVTDQEVEDLYQSLVAADKELYENDIAAYESYNSYVDQMAMYAALYGTSSDLDYAWYKPEGFRAKKRRKPAGGCGPSCQDMRFSGFRHSSSGMTNLPSFRISTSSNQISPPPYSGRWIHTRSQWIEEAFPLGASS